MDDVTIGRDPDNTVRLADPTVSRVHARISSTAGGALLEDAGSSYGTWLDGRRRPRGWRPARGSGSGTRS
jgi:pSer/pThr/pTyr-binding forkhead associated (FHA) protein